MLSCHTRSFGVIQQVNNGPCPSDEWISSDLFLFNRDLVVGEN
jgi:hypothetical protein